MKLEPFFADLERRLDEQQEERVARAWMDFADLRLTDGAFCTRRVMCPSEIKWEPMLVNDALDDESCMIYQQLYLVHQVLESGRGEMLCVRSNYGTHILPSLVGAELFVLERGMNTLPGSRPFENGKDGIVAMLEKGQPQNLNQGYAGKVFSMAEQYGTLVKAYPKVARYVHYYNPDLQGPLALCEAVWGSSFYLDLYDDDDLVRKAFDFFTQLYLRFTQKWHALCPPYDAQHSVEWGCLHRGHTIIRDDAAMNISGDMYEEFAKPCDQKIISAFGGGIHFCGRGHHYIEHVAAIKGLSCVNMSEPHLNEMETIYGNTVDKDIIIFGLVCTEAQRALASGRNLRGRVHQGASVAAWLDRKDR